MSDPLSSLTSSPLFHVFSTSFSGLPNIPFSPGPWLHCGKAHSCRQGHRVAQLGQEKPQRDVKFKIRGALLSQFLAMSGVLRGMHPKSTTIEKKENTQHTSTYYFWNKSQDMSRIMMNIARMSKLNMNTSPRIHVCSPSVSPGWIDGPNGYLGPKNMNGLLRWSYPEFGNRVWSTAIFWVYDYGIRRPFWPRHSQRATKRSSKLRKRTRGPEWSTPKISTTTGLSSLSVRRFRAKSWYTKSNTSFMSVWESHDVVYTCFTYVYILDPPKYTHTCKTHKLIRSCQTQRKVTAHPGWQTRVLESFADVHDHLMFIHSSIVAVVIRIGIGKYRQWWCCCRCLSLSFVLFLQTNAKAFGGHCY